MYEKLNYYKLEDFKEYKVIIDKGGKVATDIGNDFKKHPLPQRFFKELNSDQNLQDLFKGMKHADKSGSERDMALACALVKRRYNDNEIAVIIYHAPYEKKTGRNKSYMESTIGKARGKVEGNSNDTNSEENAWEYLCSLSLSSEDIENVEINYLIDGFLVENSLTMISGQHNQGKSILSLAIAKYLVEKGIHVIYLDSDMPIQSISDRIKQAGLQKYFNDKFVYIQCGNRKAGNIRIDSEGWNKLKEKLRDMNHHAVIIIDNLKDFSPPNTEFNDDSAMVTIMNHYKEIRGNGFTIIVLHHRDKESRTPFKNSGSIADALDVGYVLKNVNGRLELESFKDRIRVDKNRSFEVTKDFTLVPSLSSEEETLYEALYLIYNSLTDLSNEQEFVLQQDILDRLKGKYGKEKITSLLRFGEGKLWKVEKGGKKALHYKLIDLVTDKSKNPNIKDEIIRIMQDHELS